MSQPTEQPIVTEEPVRQTRCYKDRKAVIQLTNTLDKCSINYEVTEQTLNGERSWDVSFYGPNQ